MEQGKTYSINYKVKVRMKRKESEWFCHENAHEKIISKEDFYMVQRLLTLDFRTSPNNDKVYLFSGILRCSKCDEVLLRRKKTIKDKTYIYYGCYDKDKKLRCEHICIREDYLEKAVLKTIQGHIDTIIQMTKLIDSIEKIPLKNTEIKSIDKLLAEKNKELEKYQNIKLRLYEDYHEKFISSKEYKNFEKIYDVKEEEVLKGIAELLIRKEQILNGNTENQLWVQSFIKYSNVQKLDRKLILSLVENIVVSSQNQIEIFFCYKDEFQATKEVLISKDIMGTEEVMSNG